jgi:hypothetical protein
MPARLKPSLAQLMPVLIAALMSQSVSAEKCGNLLDGVAHAFDSKRNAIALKVGTISERDWIVGLQFSPNSDVLATALMDRRDVELWDWRKSHVAREFKSPNRGPNGVFSQFVNDPLRFDTQRPLLMACHSGYGGDYTHGQTITTMWNSDSGVVYDDVIYPGACKTIN